MKAIGWFTLRSIKLISKPASPAQTYYDTSGSEPSRLAVLGPMGSLSEERKWVSVAHTVSSRKDRQNQASSQTPPIRLYPQAGPVGTMQPMPLVQEVSVWSSGP